MKTKQIVITGGTTGIGMALAKSFLKEEGFDITVMGRSRDKYSTSFTPEEQKIIHFQQIDVSNPSQVESVLKKVLRKDASEIIIVANAGIAMSKKETFPTMEEADRIFKTNVIGAYATLLESAKFMIEYNINGHLAVTSSLASLMGLPRTGSYSSSKSAISFLAQSLAIDLKQYGIGMTTILPGFVETPLTATNKHQMPFLLKDYQAANIIKRGLLKKKRIVAVPLALYLPFKTISLLPSALGEYLLRIFGGKMLNSKRNKK